MARLGIPPDTEIDQMLLGMELLERDIAINQSGEYPIKVIPRIHACQNTFSREEPSGLCIRSIWSRRPWGASSLDLCGLNPERIRGIIGVESLRHNPKPRMRVSTGRINRSLWRLGAHQFGGKRQK